MFRKLRAFLGLKETPKKPVKKPTAKPSKPELAKIVAKQEKRSLMINPKLSEAQADLMAKAIRDALRKK